MAQDAGGERVQLYAERALYWPAGRTLFVADVHLGKTAAFRAGGVALPGGATAANLERLSWPSPESACSRCHGRRVAFNSATVPARAAACE